MYMYMYIMCIYMYYIMHNNNYYYAVYACAFLVLCDKNLHVHVERWWLKPVALGSIPGGCPDFFSSS